MEILDAPFLAGLSMAFTIIALAAWLLTLLGFVISRFGAPGAKAPGSPCRAIRAPTAGFARRSAGRRAWSCARRRTAVVTLVGQDLGHALGGHHRVEHAVGQDRAGIDEIDGPVRRCASGARTEGSTPPELRSPDRGVLPAIADLDGDHRRHAALLDQIIEDRGQVVRGPAAVAEHETAPPCRHSAATTARVRQSPAWRDDHVRLVAWRVVVIMIELLEQPGVVADQARIVDHALLRRDGERGGRAAWNAFFATVSGARERVGPMKKVAHATGRRHDPTGSSVAADRSGCSHRACRPGVGGLSVDERLGLVARVGAGRNGHVLGDAGRRAMTRARQIVDINVPNRTANVFFINPRPTSLFISSSKETSSSG